MAFTSFNVPDVDFNCLDDTVNESYFDVDHESTSVVKKTFRTPFKMIGNELHTSEFQTPQSNLKKARSSSKKSCRPSFPSDIYNLRATPIRLSRVYPIPFDAIADDEVFSIHQEMKTEAIPEEPSILEKRSQAPRATVPKPFHFAETKRKRQDSVNFKSFAEQIAAFQKTPKRYRTAARGTVFRPMAKEPAPKRARPQTPNLYAVKRSRPVHALSEKEREELEVKRMKEHRFQAQPLNEKIYKHDTAKMHTRKTTTPAPFHLETDRRAAHANVKSVKEDEQFVFHATEIPKNILKHTVGIKEKAQIKCTVPKSPQFALKKREEAWKNMEQNVSASVTKDHGQSCFPTSHMVSKCDSTKMANTTVVKPFSFENRERARLESKAVKLQKELEEKRQKYVFKARAIPGEVFSPTVMTPAPHKITKPKPFNFLLDTKKSNTSRDEVNQTPIKVFRAQPASVVKKKPFLPKKTKRNVITHTTPSLNTQKRANQREMKREVQLREEKENMAQVQENLKIEEEKKKQELKALRDSLVHKANPVTKFKPVKVQPSSKPLTKPKSPEFATNARFKHA